MCVSLTSCEDLKFPEKGAAILPRRTQRHIKPHTHTRTPFYTHGHLVRAACSDPNPPSPPRPSELVAMLFAPVLAIPFDLVSTPPSNASALPLLVLLATSPAVDCCWCAAMVVGACCCAGLLLLIAALSLRTPAALSSCSSGPAMLSSLETKAGSID